MGQRYTRAVPAAGAVCTLFLAALTAACAPWPLGRHLDARSSDLVGEWAIAPLPGRSDTVVWRFHPDGQYEVLQMTDVRRERGATGALVTSALVLKNRGHWGTYEEAQDTGMHKMQLVCFDRRPRSWPSCRYFRVDSGGRAATWEGWVGETHRTRNTLVRRPARLDRQLDRRLDSLIVPPRN
jgi:hypothetical protein